MDLDPYSEQLNRPRNIPRLSALEKLLEKFSPGERFLLYCFSIVLAVSALALLAGLNESVSVVVPARGGVLTEGEVGPARFINPVLTLSQPDQDLSQLVYSGLTRVMPDGTVVPDLAQSWQISPDGKTYTFTLRPGLTFQDGTPVTADDVLFTVEAVQNPDIKSPQEADWVGVQVSSPDARTVVFTLPQPYAPFIYNTSLGILPKHIWENVSSEEFPFSPANTHPIGSGPYRVVGVQTDDTGSATRYDLAPFNNYALGQPYLSHITFDFYPDNNSLIAAFNAGQIDAIAGVSPEDLASLKRTDVDLAQAPLPRVFGVFFNQNHASVLADSSVRAALNAAVDKQAIIDSVFDGYGVALDGPLPPSASNTIAPAVPHAFPQTVSSSTPAVNASDVAAARAILQKGGWKFLPTGEASTSAATSTNDTSSGAWVKGSGKSAQTLSFTLATADEPELVETANDVASQWRAAGVQVSVQVYPLSEFNTNVLRPRDYDAVLFGEVVGRSGDLFAFWDSKERNDPGLNLAMYANSKVDALLDQARATTDPTQRQKLDAQLESDINADQPAVFLYSPDFLYVVPRSLQGVQLGALTTASERFLNVYQWYTDTQRVWSIFTDQT